MPQYEVRLPDGRAARLDVAYSGVRLGIEADSYIHHSSAIDCSADQTRRNALVADGRRILPASPGPTVPQSDHYRPRFGDRPAEGRGLRLERGGIGYVGAGHRALGRTEVPVMVLELWLAPVRNLDWVSARFGHR